MQEMLYPTSYIKAKGLGRPARCSRRRFSGGTSGLSIGTCPGSGGGRPHRPGATATGSASTSERRIDVLVSDRTRKRRAEQDEKGWEAGAAAQRKVSAALKAYAKLAMSADKGAVRDLSMLED